MCLQDPTLHDSHLFRSIIFIFVTVFVPTLRSRKLLFFRCFCNQRFVCLPCSAVHATLPSNQIFHLMRPWSSSWNAQLANMFLQPFVFFWGGLVDGGCFWIDITLFSRTWLGALAVRLHEIAIPYQYMITFLLVNARVCYGIGVQVGGT